MLANYMLSHTSKRGRILVDTDLELELLKCLKTSLSNKVGYKAATLTPVRGHRRTEQTSHRLGDMQLYPLASLYLSSLGRGNTSLHLSLRRARR